MASDSSWLYNKIYSSISTHKTLWPNRQDKRLLTHETHKNAGSKSVRQVPWSWIPNFKRRLRHIALLWIPVIRRNSCAWTISQWSSPANSEVELRAPEKSQNQQEGVQSKRCPRVKNALKSVALAVKGGWEVPGDQWRGMASCKSHRRCTVRSR